MINNKDAIIVISKDSIEFGGEKLVPPFKIEEVKRVLGEGRYFFKELKDCGIPGLAVRNQVWDELGIFASLNDKETEVRTFCVCVVPNSHNHPKKLYEGRILIGSKDYTECKWKFDGRSDQEMKQGCFHLLTLSPDLLPEIEDEDRDIAEMSASRMEITYIPPKVKKSKKFTLTKLDEPVLEFTNLNFKLAVIQKLMYEKDLLEPQFDIYEFAKEYTRREIDIDDEGYEPIKEAKKWFKDLQIPKRLAGEVTELEMDGGDDIYFQIVPFWDGEDEIFDINKITEAEVRQFPNLRHMTLMSSKPKKVVEVFEKCGVEVELL